MVKTRGATSPQQSGVQTTPKSAAKKTSDAAAKKVSKPKAKSLSKKTASKSASSKVKSKHSKEKLIKPTNSSTNITDSPKTESLDIQASSVASVQTARSTTSLPPLSTQKSLPPASPKVRAVVKRLAPKAAETAKRSAKKKVVIKKLPSNISTGGCNSAPPLVNSEVPTGTHAVREGGWGTWFWGLFRR